MLFTTGAYIQCMFKRLSISINHIELIYTVLISVQSKDCSGVPINSLHVYFDIDDMNNII